MKKILIIHSDEFLTKENPLGGIFQLDQAKHLIENNYKVNILSAGLLSPRKFFKGKNYLKFEKIGKINIYRKYKKNILPSRVNILNKIIAEQTSSIGIELFEEYLKKNPKPDLIHSHDLRYGSFITHKIFKKYRIPYVITEHNSDILEKKFPKILVPQINKIIKDSKKISTVSKLMAYKLKKFFKIKKKIFILHNVLPEIFLKKKNLSIKNKILTFISVTRFDKNKNVELLIEAFDKVLKKRNCVLKIIGSGPLLNKVKINVKKKGLSKKIILLGHLDRKNIIKNLLKSDCFVLNSKVETFGVATIEAMSCGLKAILSENAGSIEIKSKIPDVIIYKPNNIKNLYKKMLKINSLKNKFEKQKIRNVTMQQFGVRNFLNQIKKIY